MFSLDDKYAHLSCVLKILLRNYLQNARGIQANEFENSLSLFLNDHTQTFEIALYPTRILMQDFTGVPAIVDFVAMRDHAADYGVDADSIEPEVKIDLVIDHSVVVNAYRGEDALAENMRYEMDQNKERFLLLKWADYAFDKLSVVPPGKGICHQVNIEYLTDIVTEVRGVEVSEMIVGTDSHTTMVNGLGVVGWGVGGIEAESCALGQPLMINMPKVIGVELCGQLNPGVTATDLVLTVAEHLKKYGVVSCMVEFFGSSLNTIDVPTRATIANMSPEFGSTCVYFPIDDMTLTYLLQTGRNEAHVAKVKKYAQEHGIWGSKSRSCHDSISINLSTIVPSIAGPYRPHDRFPIDQISEKMSVLIDNEVVSEHDRDCSSDIPLLRDGDVVLAAITSCTNTSNPSVMIAAGLIAKKAVEMGLKPKPWVKTSFAPGSLAVTVYLEQMGLLKYLRAIGFHIVGYGCTTCIGNSGALDDGLREQIHANNIKVSGVLSGNRNFTGRIHPDIIHNWLMSPPLVILYAIAGQMIDLTVSPIGHANGRDIMMHDLWPSDPEIEAYMSYVHSETYNQTYENIFQGNDDWQQLQVTQKDKAFHWSEQSTYIKKPPYLGRETAQSVLEDNTLLPILAIFGDFITTDHISPAGVIPLDSASGAYLRDQAVSPKDYNSYGARRGNYEVMVRGTFANVRIRNEMVNQPGGLTYHRDSPDKIETIYDVAQQYIAQNKHTVVIAGRDYGSGSSRDWAAKGTYLLGVRAVIAESFERIHRSNLIGMGVIPFQFMKGEGRRSLSLTGNEIIRIEGLDQMSEPRQRLRMIIERQGGVIAHTHVLTRIDSAEELAYYQNGGILRYALKKMAKGGAV